ncbi:MAG TPA: 2-aminoethylphosphonate--pyruvate transaminase [Bacillota bacterium]|nr:2-aminoethylphosphonate--pyruvate transaminase [Bacillota bacterium]
MTKYDFANNPYLLLTPGPLTTSDGVRLAMMKDWCTWDDDYNNIVQGVRKELVKLASKNRDKYSAVLMQGSGTFVVESMIGTVVPEDGKLFIIANGAYGYRIAEIAKHLQINHVIHDSGEVSAPDLEAIEETLKNDEDITHVAVVHCETTTGRLNPLEKIAPIINKYNKIFFVDAMSSFAGVEMDIDELGIDYIVSSANKCIEGVPGFGFAIVNKEEFAKTEGNARSLSLDLYDQWKTMEEQNGKWRFTSPTHVVRAFAQALEELEEEGGIPARAKRYRDNQKTLSEGMQKLGFKVLLPEEDQSPIITSFHFPESDKFTFEEFYERLKAKGFVIYPGKVTNLDTFRIGNIGQITPDKIKELLKAIEESMYWKE